MDERDWGHATWTDLAAAGLGKGRMRRRAGNAPAEGSSATGEGVPAPAERSPAPRQGFPVTEDGSTSLPPVVALLPVGAVEAHGPHLPVIADVIIAQAAAQAALDGLDALGFRPLTLPPLAYTAAPFAAEFPGTISVRPATVSALVSEIAAALAQQGAAALVVVNAHLDPAHLASLRQGAADYERLAGADEPRECGVMPVIFPDVTRKPWALRLTDEFKSGACHAGQYETSVLMATAPELVREQKRRTLPPHRVSLSLAHKDGAATFGEAGVPDAYCGDPAAATPEEGAETLRVLGQIVTDAVAERLDEPEAGPMEPEAEPRP